MKNVVDRLFIACNKYEQVKRESLGAIQTITHLCFGLQVAWISIALVIDVQYVYFSTDQIL